MTTMSTKERNRTVEFKVVGLTFVEGYPENLHRLREIDDERKAQAVRAWMTMPDMSTASDGVFNALAEFEDRGPVSEPLPIVLIRNPDNEYDENAIEVHVPALGRHGMIGHIPRELAERLAPQIDAGEEWAAEIVAVLVSPENPSNPGIEIECWLEDRETA
jgi:hypothetical protein